MDQQSEFDPHEYGRIFTRRKNSAITGVLINEFLPDLEKVAPQPENAVEEMPVYGKKLKEMLTDSLPGREVEFIPSRGDSHEIASLIKDTANADVFVFHSDVLGSHFDRYSGIFEKLECPVLFCPSEPFLYRNILVLNDGSSKVLDAVKKARKTIWFDPEKTVVSVLSIQSGKRIELQRERHLVSYLLKRFDSVGVLSICPTTVNRDIDRLIDINPGNLLISGSSGNKFLLEPENREWILRKNIPFLYVN